MAIGPGKYDAETTAVRVSTGAKGVVLIVLEGDRGNGFEIQGPFELTAVLPRMLRDVATAIESERS